MSTDTKPFGSLTIVAQTTVDGAFSINTFTGPIREANLCLTVSDRYLAREAYQVIAEGGLAGVRVEGIHQALLDLLTNELHQLQRRYDTPSRRLAAEINRILDGFDTPAVREELISMGDRINNRALAELKKLGTPTQVAPLRTGRAKDTDPQRAALAIAVRDDYIVRGGQPGQAPLNVLRAMARPQKRWVTLVYKPGTRIVIGAIPTANGKRAHESRKVVA